MLQLSQSGRPKESLKCFQKFTGYDSKSPNMKTKLCSNITMDDPKSPEESTTAYIGISHNGRPKESRNCCEIFIVDNPKNTDIYFTVF